ncbi:MAG TPA: helix-turn-helix transcriptional regulator [Tepidisphaeraceae bacterium]|jgi:predicted XRE-type DNA-binding protein
MNKKTKIYNSSGNVFADIGIKNPEEYLAKARLAAQILKIIQTRRFTQAHAAKLLGISQPKISALLNGRLDGFSTDRLFRFLTALGCDIRVNISRSHPRSHGKVLITAA